MTPRHESWRRGATTLLAVLTAMTAACAHRHGTATQQPLATAPPVSVHVTNNSQSAMEIYAVGAGTSYHLGTVAPGIPRSFELRPSMIAAGGHVSFLAQASGAGPRVQSEDLFLRPGDVVDFEITTNLVGSRATVRP
jgi:hypothetical protein